MNDITISPALAIELAQLVMSKYNMAFDTEYDVEAFGWTTDDQAELLVAVFPNSEYDGYFITVSM